MARENCGTSYVTCNTQGMSFEDILRALIVTDGNGCFYINTVATVGDCNDYQQAIACGTNEGWEELFRKTIVLDDCGRPAIAIFADTDGQ